MTPKESYRHLRLLVKNWLRAEFHFRLGSFGALDGLESQKALCDAEDALREFVTGHSQLLEAGEAMGMQMAEFRFETKRQAHTKRKKKSKK